MMRIESKLCHFSENRVIVQVIGWINEKNVGSALAEGSKVEEAEDKAITRLKQRISLSNIQEENIVKPIASKINKEINIEISKNEKIDSIKTNQEPHDWSNELAAIESELKRLNWSREDEIKLLEKTLGYNNRNKITKYNEIINYLNILKKIDNSKSFNLESINISDLIEESELILKDLSWDHNKGREYLQKEFNVSTRKQLDENQLISFVSKLKSIRNESLSK